MHAPVLNPARSGIKARTLTILILGVLLSSLVKTATAFCDVIHIGISPQAVPKTNINDVLTAIKVWSQTAAREQGIQATLQVDLIDSPARLRKGMDERSIEIAVTTTHIVLQMSLPVETIFVSVPECSCPIHYVLLVHRDRAITNLMGLKDSSVAIPRGNYMQLADIWLNVQLQTHVHTSASSFLAEITHPEDLSEAGMQVFFHQTDAAVIPKDTLDRMGALNPQIQKDLFIMEESPRMIPVVLIVRPSWQTPLRHAMEQVIAELHTTPLGKKLLSVFQCARLEKKPITILEPTLSLLQKNQNVTQKNGDRSRQ